MALTPEEKRERRNEYQRRWRAANPTYSRDHRRKWLAENAEKELENQRRWRAANPDKVQQKNARWYAAHPEEARAASQRARYARPEDVAAMYEAHQGRCYLCGELLPAERRKWVIEHDHRCHPEGQSCADCRRGLACVRCNTLIGLAGDDPAALRRIADNLEAAIADVTRRLAERAASQPALFEVAELDEAGEAS